MVFTAEFTGEKEIIFPEIAALAVGSFLTERFAWRASWPRMIICLELCSLIGVGVVRYGPESMWAQITLAYVGAQLVLMFSRTSLAPMISASILPVITQTRSAVDLISALAFTCLIVILRIALEKFSIKETNNFSPAPWPNINDWETFAFRTVCVACLAYIFMPLGLRFCLAPPLLVAFTELCRKECKVGDKRLQVIALITLCAIAGAACRYVIAIKAGLPLTVSAVIVGMAMIALICRSHIYFPPAGPMVIVALLPSDSALFLYPAEIFLGIAVMSLLSFIWVNFTEKYHFNCSHRIKLKFGHGVL